jgi:nucleoid-associated protein YejK
MFADFVNTDISDRYLLVLTTNNKDGYMVSDDLKIQDIKNIDLSKVDIACMINLTKWEDIDNGVDTDTKTYLSFVKGNKNISYYFLSYIDCNNKTTNTESTKRLTNALNEYAKEKAYDRNTTIKKRNAVYQYCDDCLKTKKEIQLSAISALLDPESPEGFSEFASDEKYGVSETIKGDRAQLRKMKYIMYADEKYRLEFDSDLLGKEVVYNRQKNELTFKSLPEDLIKQIPQ